MPHRRHILDSELWVVEILARYGFSYKFIARRAFRDKEQYRLVGRALRKLGIRVTDYRNGETRLSREVANKVVKT